MIDTYGASITLSPIRTSCHTSMETPQFSATWLPIVSLAPRATAMRTSAASPSAVNWSPKTASPRMCSRTFPRIFGSLPNFAGVSLARRSPRAHWATYTAIS